MSFDIKKDSEFLWVNSQENPGYIYIIQNNDNHYKIGITNNLQRRIRQFKTANSNRLSLIKFSSVKDNRLVEKFLHKKFKSKQLIGEWFNLTNEDLQYIEEIFRSLYYRQQSKIHQLLEVDEDLDPK